MKIQMLVLSPLPRYHMDIRQEVKVMANAEHLALIQQGPTAWNSWRKQRPEIRLDLSGANPVGADLVGADLVEVDLTRAVFKESVPTFKAKGSVAGLPRKR